MVLMGTGILTVSANPGDFTPWDAAEDAAIRAATKAEERGARYETIERTYWNTLQTIWAFETCRWNFATGKIRWSGNLSAGHNYSWCMKRAIDLDWDAAVIENTLLKQ